MWASDEVRGRPTVAVGHLLSGLVLAATVAGCSCDGSTTPAVPGGCPAGRTCPDGGGDGGDPDAGEGDAGAHEDGGVDAGCTETCARPRRICDADNDRCVECLIDDHCESRLASRCQEDFTCGPCTADSQCKEMDFLDCDEIQDGGSGACVECTPGNDARFCGAFSCDPETQRCTTRPAGSVGRCGRCRATLECASPLDDCVPATFDDRSVPDGVCLPPASEACSRPTPDVSEPRAALGTSDAEPRCIPPENLTSCAALVSYGEDCDGEEDCGLGRGDGTCERGAGGIGTCRSFCRNEDDCPLDAACGDDGVCRPDD